ncbi:MAG: NAD(P)H-dependent oxidoreductase subunit E [Gemmatimonadaceae bacterium]
MSHGPSTPAIGTGQAHAHPPYDPVFTPGSARSRELADLITRYPDRRAALLPALWMVQNDRGWISEEAMIEVGDQLGCTAAYVKGVVTFYTMYHQHPVGRHFIQICTTSPCLCAGAGDVVKAFLEHTGCKELGLTSPDGKYTVIEVECLGACGFATPVQINEDCVENVTPEKVPEILEGLT